MKKLLLAALWLTGGCVLAQSQPNLGQISGNFQTIAQYYLRDTLIDPAGEAFPDEGLLGTGFLNLTYTRGDFRAGVRYENYQNNRVGLPVGYEGQGITYRYARFMGDQFDITAGNFYEQFGSGLILRAYEERGLGLDNNLDGVRLIFRPAEGITLKGVLGRQRNYFDVSSSIVRGFDADWSLKRNLGWEGPNNLIIGAGIVSKYQDFDSPTYNVPNNVASGALRVNFITPTLNLSGEYAYKANDPSGDNFFIFKPGHAFYFTGSYAKGNFGAILNAKYYDNFSWRSEPVTDPQQLLIGYLPSATTLHTYALPALYAYNTVLSGEQGAQLELSYKFPRKSFFGGKYGTLIRGSLASSYSLNKDYITRETPEGRTTISGTDGYTTNFGLGPYQYFQDFHFSIKKKLNKKLRLTGTYYNFYFNEDALRKGVAGTGDYLLDTSNAEVVDYNINAVVLDFLWKVKSRHSLRAELQGLWTEGDRGDWGLLLLEYSIAPKWFFAVQDAYNYGNADPDLRIHYLSVNAGYTMGSTRLQLGYGRQQEGVFCVGGICRVVPASNGFTLTVTSNF
ncbi:MAG: DUF6029 family protein [Owenweeksia sp.]|nr:DUF6029 family protein [Owenweeksia sp.]